MDRVLHYQIGEKEEGLRVEQFLRRRGYSRQNLVQVKKYPDGAVVNGQNCHMDRRLRAGDAMKVSIREEEPKESIIPVRLPLDIVYEDEDLLVVNKPAGMPVHPSMNNYRNSLANAAAWYYKEQGLNFVFRCGNRLDRDTSGLTVIAKNMLSATILASMTADRSMRREYLAVVRGSVRPEKGTIDAPLGRKPGSVIERVVDFESGEPAVTHYRSVEERNGHSLVSLRLETGRTHQIRIHMKYLGFPIIGDYLYNPDMEHIKRQALHCCRLNFPHPVTGKVMKFTAPLPEDMRNVISDAEFWEGDKMGKVRG